MSGAVIIQSTTGQELDLSAMIQSAVTAGITEVETQRKSLDKRGRSDKGTGSAALGRTLEGHRNLYNMSQSELATRAGVHPTTISKIESGERGMSMQTLARLSLVLDTTFPHDVLWQYAGYGDEGNADGDAARGESSGPVEEHSIQDDDRSA